MAFSRTWNAAYEAQPADTENISLGASRIRNLKEDIQERLEVDHFHAGDAQDGEHKKLTLGAPIATPANIANKAFVYGKDVGGKIELHYLDEDGNEVQITSVGNVAVFPSTTSILFYQSAAPVGWTKDVAATLDKHALRLVTSTAWVTGSTGTNAFEAVLGASPTAGGHTLTVSEMPAHVHNALIGSGSGGAGEIDTSAIFATTAPIARVDSTGGDGEHKHDLDIKFFNVIRATKD